MVTQFSDFDVFFQLQVQITLDQNLATSIAFEFAYRRSSFVHKNGQLWQFSRCSMFCSIPHSHFVEMSCRMPHFCRLFLDLSTPTLSLLRDLQVGQSNSYPAAGRNSAGSDSSLLFSLERESFHLSLRTSSGCLFRGFVVFRILYQ